MAPLEIHPEEEPSKDDQDLSVDGPWFKRTDRWFRGNADTTASADPAYGTQMPTQETDPDVPWFQVSVVMILVKLSAQYWWLAAPRWLLV